MVFDYFRKIGTKRIMIMFIGNIIIGMGLSLMVSDRSKKVPYFWWRILFDALCALIGFLAGGLIGIGILVCAFGMGTCTHFFNVHLSEKLLPKKENEKFTSEGGIRYVWNNIQLVSNFMIGEEKDELYDQNDKK